MPKNTTKLGNQAEDLATDYLKRKGCKILERNFRNRFCEIDIIALKKDQIIFVEVKYRKSDQFGEPIYAITRDKMRRLTRAANFYLSENSEYFKLAPRIDIISISGELHSPQIEHLENCFR
ncbi:MAG: YraN family protein [bacterium]|nr:YraN family protein [bacterium]